jgi:hypothetical protein
MIDTSTFIGLANFLTCMAIDWICVCRFSLMSEDTTSPRVRLAYVLISVAFTSSAFSAPLLGERPGAAQLLVAVAALAFILAGVDTWRHGPPNHARRSGHVPPLRNPPPKGSA